MNTAVLHFELNSWEARLLLEACRCLYKGWLAAADAVIDEDERAHYSNDLGQLDVMRRRLEHEACSTFGPDIKQFSRVSIS